MSGSHGHVPTGVPPSRSDGHVGKYGASRSREGGKGVTAVLGNSVPVPKWAHA